MAHNRLGIVAKLGKATHCIVASRWPADTNEHVIIVCRLQLPQEPVNSRWGALFVAGRVDRHPNADCLAHLVDRHRERRSCVGDFILHFEHIFGSRLSAIIPRRSSESLAWARESFTAMFVARC